MPKTRHIVRNASIGTKIMLFVLISLIASVAIIFWFSTGSYNNFLDQMNQKQAATALNDLDKNVKDLTSQSTVNVQMLADDSVLSDAVKQKDSGKLGTLIGEKNKALLLDFITVTDSQGLVLFSLNDQVKLGDSILTSQGVQSALAGTAYTGFELDASAGLIYKTVEPVKDGQGNIIGFLSAGCSMAKEPLLDSLKAIHGTDFTIFAGNIRLVTTIIQDGKRLVGTPLAPATADIVIKNKKTYFGQADILKQKYVTAYMPVLDAGGNSVGVLFAGMPLSEVKNEENTILTAVLVLGLILLAAVSVAVVLFMRSTVSKPMLKMVDNARRISIGDIDTEMSAYGKAKDGKGAGTGSGHNEILLLNDAFSQIVLSAREQSRIAAEIANGNTGVQMQARSDKDTLTHSMIRVIETLKGLAAEINKLITASKEGNFILRGDAARFNGDYSEMVSGVNDILDEVLAAMNEVQGARKAAEKQAQYQAGEVGKLVVNLQRLSNGELYCDMEAAPADKDTEDSHELFAQISGNLHSTVRAIKGYIVDISAVLDKIADGDLSAKITADFHGEFAKLKDSINAIVDSLSSVLSNINHSAEQVTAGSSQVSDSSQALSQGAAEQASSVEQLTAFIARIAEQTRMNASNASQASELVKNASTYAERGNAQMQDMLSSMADINESSKNISMITKVIDDISFQTNILALNAAVEAARAGVHGKGFAIVADEVRSLAAKSADAAREITGMIEESIKKVEQGTLVANETAGALKEIVSGVENADKLVAEIATASGEQAAGIAQVNTGLEQVSRVVQSNSATAEQSAAASEELYGQAETLKEMVGHFRLTASSGAGLLPARKTATARITAGSAQPDSDSKGRGKY